MRKTFADYDLCVVRAIDPLTLADVEARDGSGGDR